MMRLKNHVTLSLGYFILAAGLGVVLRSFHSVEIPVNYKFIVHTHSHIALLGWVYMGLTTLLYKLFLENLDLGIKYRRIFWFTQVTLAGMLVTFPFQGYALFSIIFSTLFLFASYWFTWFFVKNVPQNLKKTNSYKCVKYALGYMVVSSIGPWVLGAIMATLGPTSIWYRLAIYFYLHFQYNGWMVLALLGVLFYVLEAHNVKAANKVFKKFFWSINLGIVFSFSLSTLWTDPSVLFYVLGAVGALMQLYAIVVLGRVLILLKGFKNIFSRLQFWLVKLTAILLLFKMCLQLLTAIPFFANLASTILDFTIGYLHLTFLGVVTIGLFLFFDYFRLMKIKGNAFLIYVMGFFITEVLIFYKGMATWWGLGIFHGYFEVLALGSLLILVSLVLLLKPKRE